MSTTIVDRIDQRITHDLDEISRLEHARAELTKLTNLTNLTSGHAIAPVHALTAARALATIRKHPGQSARKLGIGPRTISALAQDGRIVRQGVGWEVAGR
jgi:uncharacterized protein YjhX (UPF0386 family)